MEGPFVQDGGMGMNMGMGMEMAISPDMERWFEDYEWSTCWDFEASSWGPSKQQQQQQPSWMMPQGQPAWMMPPGPPMGQQGGWGGFPDPSWSGGGGKGGPPGTLEGPYMGDANSGDQGDDWGGGFGGGWQGGGKGGGGKKGGSSDRGKGKGKQQEEEWGSSWKQESWNKDGWKGEERGRKGAGKKGAEEEPRWKPEGKDRGGKKGEKGEKGGGKDGKSSGKDGKSAGKGEKGEKGRWAPKEEESKGWGRGEPAEAKWKPRDAVGGPEAREEKTNSRDDAAKDEVNAEIMTLVDASGSNLEKQDFDPRIRKFLIGLRNSGGRQKVKDALAMIQTYTAQKTRQSVKNWPAYLLTLLRKFEPDGEKGAKGKGKGRTNDREQEIEETKPALKPASKKAAAAPVAASAGAAATQSGDGEVEVVRATQEVDVRPAPAADMPRLEMKLPPGWEDGRRELHEEISNSLLGSGQTADDLRNPFTSDSIDIEATLVSHVVTCLRSTASQPGGHHLVGLARSRAVQDCPRAAAAAALVGGNSELGALSDNASAMDAVAACTAAGASAAAATVLQEIALELTAEVLRNSQLGPVVAAA